MKQLQGVTYFVPIPTGEMDHLKHPIDSDKIIHSVPRVKRQPVSAIVVGEHEGELLDLVFVHPQRLTTLSSGDWQNALERAYGVRPEGHPDLEDGDERLGYYADPLADTTEGRDAALQALADKYAKLPAGEPSSVETETKHYADGSSATGPGPLPDHSPAEQEALRAIQDSGQVDNSAINVNGGPLPSGADLDAVADEAKAKDATDGKKVRVIRGSKA